MNTTACANQNAIFFCGFTGVNPLHLILNWSIIWRNTSDSIIHDKSYSVYMINADPNNGLEWVPDFNNANNSRLVIDSVNKMYNQSSFQCIISSADGNKIVSTIGYLTVAGKSLHSYNTQLWCYVHTCSCTHIQLVICITYNTGKSDLPDIYAQCLRTHSARE